MSRTPHSVPAGGEIDQGLLAWAVNLPARMLLPNRLRPHLVALDRQKRDSPGLIARQGELICGNRQINHRITPHSYLTRLAAQVVVRTGSKQDFVNKVRPNWSDAISGYGRIS